MMRTLGPLLFDAISWLVFALVVVPPSLACCGVLAGLVAIGVPWWVALGLAPALVPLFLVGLCLDVWLLRLCVPRPRKGVVAFPGSGRAVRWALHFALRRVLLGPPWERWILGTQSLRWLALTALGGRVHPSVMMSGDVAILDGWALEIGAGSLIGAESTLVGHAVEGARLVLGPIRIGREVQVRAAAKIAIGVTIGDGVSLGTRATLRPFCTVGEGATLGTQVDVGTRARVGAGAVIGDRVIIEDGARVAAGEEVAAGTVVRRGAV